MASFNRVILVGNLTRDPELRRAPSGSAVAELRLAVSETYRDRQTGEQKEVACYVDVVVWERQAETCQQYLSKGRQVLVEGRLVYDEWKNPQGESRNRLRVRADRVQFLGSPPARREESREAPPPGAAALAAPAGAEPAGAGAAPAPLAAEARAEEDGKGDDEDLPF